MTQSYRAGLARREEVITGVVHATADSSPATQLEQMQNAVNSKLSSGGRVKHFRQTELNSNFLIVTFVIEYPA